MRQRAWVGAVRFAAVVAAALGLTLAGCREDPGARSAISGFRVMPEEVDFGFTAIGMSKPVEVTLSNDGSAPYTVYAIGTSIPNVEVGPIEPFTLRQGESKVVTVTFVPAVEGVLEGALTVETDSDRAGEKGLATLPLRGTGVRAVANVPARLLDFGNVELDTAAVRSLEVSNPTPAPVIVRFSLTGVDRDEYSAAEADRDVPLRAGEVRKIDIGFKPTRLGAAEGEARITVCPGCEPVVVTLAGTGIASRLEISPMVVGFGRVSVGSSARQTVTIRNLGTTTMDYFGAQLVDDAGGAFTVVNAPPLAGNQLAPGQSVAIDLGFTPTAAVQVRGLVQLRVGEPGVPGPKLPLSGEGGASCVALKPKAIDFGGVPAGMTATRSFEVANGCPGAVELTNFNVSTQAGGYFSLGGGTTFLALAPGERVRVAMSFTPKAGSTTSTGSVAFEIREDGALSTERVALSGALVTLPPCSYTLAPGAVDFFRVPLGASVVRTLTLTNTGASACFLSSFRLASGTDAAFSAPAVESTTLAAGAQAQLKVTFRPGTTGTFSGLAEAFVNSDTSPRPTAALTGQGVNDCFSLQPTHTDFGLTRTTCGPKDKLVSATNRCTAPVTLSGARLVSASGELTLAASAFPLELAPNASVNLRVRYAPTNDGNDEGLIEADVTGMGTYSASVTGQGSTRDERTDHFVQEPRAKVDVLFVIDNSGSMMEEQQNLARNFAAFMSSAMEQGSDYHLGVTTTGLDASPGGWSQCPGGVDGGENGRLFPVSGATPRIITPSTPSASSVFAYNVQVGWCHWNEQGLAAAHRALSVPLVNSTDDARTAQPNDGNAGFLRGDAKLAIVFVTDEEDFSTETVGYYETFFRALKGGDPSMLTISAIAGPSDLSTCPTASSSGSRYIALANATGGVVESICTPDWAASLSNLSRSTFGARRHFRLTEPTSDPATIVVQVDGVAVTTGWTYDASNQTVVFDEQHAPAPGTAIDISYRVGC